MNKTNVFSSNKSMTATLFQRKGLRSYKQHGGMALLEHEVEHRIKLVIAHAGPL